MKNNLRELAEKIREEVLGVGGWLLVDNGGEKLLVPAPLTPEEWEERYCPPKDEPVAAPQEPETDAHDPRAFPTAEFGGIRLEKP